MEAWILLTVTSSGGPLTEGFRINRRRSAEVRV